MATDNDDRAIAFRWLERVLSKDGPASPIEKLVMVGVFQRINWNTGEGFFESARTLGDRLGLGKSTVAACLARACVVGPFLRRTARAAGPESWRRGFTYSLSIPARTEQLIAVQQDGQKGGLCPLRTDSLSVDVESLSANSRTDSPSDSPMKPSEHADAPAPKARAPRSSLKTTPEVPDSTAAWARARARAAAIRFREPDPGESIGHYSGAVIVAEVQAKATAQRGAA